MNIKTKYNINDYCYYIKKRRIQKGKIVEILFKAYDNIVEINYVIGGCDTKEISEKELFNSPEEVCENLLKNY